MTTTTPNNAPDQAPEAPKRRNDKMKEIFAAEEQRLHEAMLGMTTPPFADLRGEMADRIEERITANFAPDFDPVDVRTTLLASLHEFYVIQGLTPPTSPRIQDWIKGYILQPLATGETSLLYHQRMAILYRFLTENTFFAKVSPGKTADMTQRVHDIFEANRIKSLADPLAPPYAAIPAVLVKEMPHEVENDMLLHDYYLPYAVFEDIATMTLLEMLEHNPTLRSEIAVEPDKIYQLPLDEFGETIDPTLAAHQKVLKDYFDVPEPDGTERRGRIGRIARLNEITFLQTAGDIASVDPALDANIQEILSGTDLEKRRLNHELLEKVQSELLPLLRLSDPSTYTRLSDPALESAYLFQLPASNFLLDPALEGNMYNQLLEQWHIVYSGLSPAAQAVATAIENADMTNPAVSDTISKTDLELLQRELATATITLTDIQTLEQKTQDLMSRADRQTLKKLLRDDHADSAYALVKSRFLHALNEIEALAYDVSGVTEASNPDLHQTLDEMRAISKDASWKKNPTLLRELCQALVREQQQQAFTGEMKELKTWYLSNDKANLINDAVTAYVDTSTPTADESKWKTDAVDATLQRAIDAARDANNAEQVKKLEELQRKFASGGIYLKDIATIASDPAIPPADRPAFEEALEHVMTNDIRNSAIGFAEQSLETLGREDDGILRQDRLFADALSANYAQAENIMNLEPQRELEDFLSDLSSGALTFTSVADAEAQLRHMYTRLRDTMQGKDRQPPHIEHLHLRPDVWFRMQGKISVSTHNWRGKKKSTKKQDVDFYAPIESITTDGVTFGNKNGPMLGTFSLEMLVFHLLNSAYVKDSPVSLVWKHDNNINTIKEPKDINKAVPAQHGPGTEKLAAGIDHERLVPNTLIKKGGKPLGTISGKFDAGRNAYPIQYNDPNEMNEAKVRNGYISVVDLYLMAQDGLLVLEPDRNLDIEGEGGNFAPISIQGFISAAHAIYKYKKDDLEYLRKVRLILQRMTLFRQGGWTDSLWVDAMAELNSAEDELAKGYKSELENLTKDDKRDRIWKDLYEFSEVNLNQRVSGSMLTDLLSVTPINKKRAQFKAMLIECAEEWGQLYPPLREGKDGQNDDQMRKNRQVLRIILGTKEENERAYEHSESENGVYDGGAEVNQVISLLRVRELYGHAYASKLTSALGKGKSHQAEVKEKRAKLCQNGGQMRKLLEDYIRTKDWQGIHKVFENLVKKEVSSEVLFNMFLFLMTESTSVNGTKGLVPHIPMNDFQSITKVVFPAAPELYYFFGKAEGNIPSFDKFVRQHPKYGDYRNFDWSDFPTPTYKGEKVELYKAWCLEKGDYTYLRGYKTAKFGDVNSNYITFLQKLNMPHPRMDVDDHDVTMWARSPLLYFNDYVFDNIVANNLDRGQGLSNDHSRKYLWAFINNVHDLLNAPGNQFTPEDREAFLKPMKAAFYSKLYSRFSFREVSPDANFRRDAQGNPVRGFLNNQASQAPDVRDAFFREFYKGKKAESNNTSSEKTNATLESIGFDMQSCAHAAGVENLTFRNLEPSDGDYNVRPYLILNTTEWLDDATYNSMARQSRPTDNRYSGSASYGGHSVMDGGGYTS